MSNVPGMIKGLFFMTVIVVVVSVIGVKIHELYTLNQEIEDSIGELHTMIEEQEQVRENVVEVNGKVISVEEVGFQVGVVQTKYKETDEDGEHYYLIVDGKVYEVGLEEYKTFYDGDTIKLKETKEN